MLSQRLYSLQVILSLRPNWNVLYCVFADELLPLFCVGVWSLTHLINFITNILYFCSLLEWINIASVQHSNMFLNGLMLFFLMSSSGHHFTVGQSHWASAGLPARPPQRERAPGAGETTDSGPAERRAGQLPQAAVSAPAGAAALGEGEGEAPAAGGGHRGQAPTKGGGVQTAGGEVFCWTWGLWNRF